MIGGTQKNVEEDDFFESQQGSREAKRDPANMPKDSDDDYWQGQMGPVKYRMMPFDVEVAGGWLRFNPVVFFVSLFGIIAFISYCNNDPINALKEIKTWKTWIADNFTWLYIGSVGLFFVFDVYLMFSRFGGVVLGPPGEPPRFSTASWFAMLFSAGIGIGLFYFGVSEPIYHYYGYNRWVKLPRYERAVAAMNVSWFHWGLAPSACYAIVGLPIAYWAHRKGMPCSMRTVFYPLMGSSIHGPIGDLIDITAVMGTIFGIGTSLGLGVNTIASGLNRIFEDDFKNNLANQKVIIWVITAFATISVATGLDYGVRRLSEGNFLLGLFVLGVLAMAGDTFFILDLFVETAGHHLWSIMDLEFHTDAFADNARIVGGDLNKAGWMNGWTVFYWGWWISWSPFVGVFIAQISKGRTVREFIMGNVFVPSILTSLWFSIYGGLGLEMEMQAEAQGLGGNYHYLQPQTGYSLGQPGATTIDAATIGAAGFPQQQLYTKTGNVCVCTTLDITNCALQWPDTVQQPSTYCSSVTVGDNCDPDYCSWNPVFAAGDTVVIQTAYDPTEHDYAYNRPACLLSSWPTLADGKTKDSSLWKDGKLKRLSCQPHADRLWDVINANSFGMEKFMSFITVVAVITYFVTSSDSGSMVVDMLCSNGLQEPPILQRIFWGIAEGAVAFSLLEAGGDEAISALQTASIAAGLPFCMIMIGMVIATYQMFIDMERDDPDFMKTQNAQVEAAAKERSLQKGPERRWKRRLLEYVNNTVMGVVCCGKPNIVDLLKAIVFPCLVDYETLTAAAMEPWFGTVLSAVFFFLFILFHVLEAAERGMWCFGWMCYFAFVAITALNRSAVRNKFNLRGDAMCDCCMVFWFYPCAVLQVNQEVEELVTETQESKTI